MESKHDTDLGASTGRYNLFPLEIKHASQSNVEPAWCLSHGRVSCLSITSKSRTSTETSSGWEDHSASMF
jgi:hypothetical protein